MNKDARYHEETIKSIFKKERGRERCPHKSIDST
jgi:hypothetical protein